MTTPRQPRQKKPKHPGVVRAFRFALDLSPAESDKLFLIKNLCWEVRERLVAERRANRLDNRQRRADGLPVHYLNRDDQYRRVAQLARDDKRFAAVHSQVLQNVAVRVDEGTQRWFDARRLGRQDVQPPGPMRCRDYHSFTYPQYGPSAKIRQGRVHLSKLGSFRLLDHRRLRGKPQTVTLTFEDGRWWVVVTCRIQAKDWFRPWAEVQDLDDTGADPGLTHLLTTAHAEVFDPPRALRDALGRLRHEQRTLSRKFTMRECLYTEAQARCTAAGAAALPPLAAQPYSNRLKAQLKKVAQLHTRVKAIRAHHHAKLAARLDKTYRRVAVEEHGVQFMLRNRRLARAAADRGLAAMKSAVYAKLGPRAIKTPNQRPGLGGNSQTCVCGAAVPKSLRERAHHCPACGLQADRDVVAANIVMLIAFGWAPLSPTGPGQGLAGVERSRDGADVPPAEPSAASENAVKRQPRVNRNRRSTGGAEATPAANTVRHRSSASLAAAAKSREA